MTRQELLPIAKPILFNTEMVQAILEGRKTVTRRVIKPQPDEKHNFPLGFVIDSTNKKDIGKFAFGIDEFGGSHQYAKPPFKKGDYLYVRETWSEWTGGYLYKAWTSPFQQPGKSSIMRWYPSIHMPKEAARLFLKVKDVRVEQLKYITGEQVIAEGISREWAMSWWKPTYHDPDSGGFPRYIHTFKHLWNSTINKADLDKYGWDTSPWVWVIEFEKVEV